MPLPTLWFLAVGSRVAELLAKSEILKKFLDEGKMTIIEAYYSLDTPEN
ncbi:MAG TPA: hypothetical protein VK828_06375 [Terriglobales bacterium]|nr:hypothetical protein [Terriglobales bacterium]